MTNQEAFDIMVEHLGNLKGQSIDPNKIACLYNGSKCVVGILMTDEEQQKYGYYMGGVRELLKKMSQEGHKSRLHSLSISLLHEMQRAHDNEYSWINDKFVSWDGVRAIAEEFDLEYKGPKA